ncbi:MAG TPA: hypothetical protein VN697_05775, partial [Tepidiformaceae bacterium]|nr:hypothetical protein [Tepidiformaceae bacterium]
PSTVTALDTATYTATVLVGESTATGAAGTIAFGDKGSGTVASGQATSPSVTWHVGFTEPQQVDVVFTSSDSDYTDASTTIVVQVNPITTSMVLSADASGNVTATISCGNGDCTALTGSVQFNNSGTGAPSKTGTVVAGTQASAVTSSAFGTGGRSVTATLTSTNSDFAGSSQLTPITF